MTDDPLPRWYEIYLELVAEAEAVIGDLTGRQHIECQMLANARVTTEDMRFALDCMDRTRSYVHDHWAYLRTAAWHRTAERIELEQSVRHGLHLAASAE